MIVARAPFRITLGGGGTDIPAWYKKHESMFISAAIDKYMYVTLYRTPFFPHIHLKYSQTETVVKLSDIKHDIIRETLKRYKIKDHVEIVSHADIPAGTGLGSSGSFGVALVAATKFCKGQRCIAEEATKIQMDILKHPIGKQDQYAAAYGGLRVYTIDRAGRVSERKLKVDYEALQRNLVLFYTGITRDANEVLKQQDLSTLNYIQQLGHESLVALEHNDFILFGQIMDAHWKYKKQRGGMTTPQIDDLYAYALKHGAIGGKIVGAGGGGFLMFMTPDRKKLIKAMKLPYLDFAFDFEGVRLLVS